MSWLSRLFGEKDELKVPSPDAAALRIRKEIRDNLEVLRFLSTCGKFDGEKCRSYVALCAQLGKPLDSNAARQLENADRMIGGYERMRIEILVPTHLQAWGTFFKLLADMRPDRATVQFLAEAKREFDAIGEQLKGKPTGHIAS
jgi:hypothetical protein